jgi:MFS family permease
MSRTQILFKTLALFFLYFAQGMPVGFIYVALPVFLRQQGVTLTLIGLANILALPWSVKFLWAPLVDKFGRRKKNWIIIMQFGMTAAVLALMQVNPASHLHLFFLLVFALNFTAATQDIAVDGLAVRILKDRETGWGNSAQVGGYRLGMLVGGGVLIYVSAALTWSGVFALMAAIILALMIIPVFIPEDDWNRAAAAPSLPSKKILSRLRSHLASAGGLALLLFVVG